VRGVAGGVKRRPRGSDSVKSQATCDAAGGRWEFDPVEEIVVPEAIRRWISGCGGHTVPRRPGSRLALRVSRRRIRDCGGPRLWRRSGTGTGAGSGPEQTSRTNAHIRRWPCACACACPAQPADSESSARSQCPWYHRPFGRRSPTAAAPQFSPRTVPRLALRVSRRRIRDSGDPRLWRRSGTGTGAGSGPEQRRPRPRDRWLGEVAPALGHRLAWVSPRLVRTYKTLRETMHCARPVAQSPVARHARIPARAFPARRSRSSAHGIAGPRGRRRQRP